MSFALLDFCMAGLVQMLYDDGDLRRPKIFPV